MRPKGMRDVIAAKDYPAHQQTSRLSKRVQGWRDVMAAQEIATRGIPDTLSQSLEEISWLEREAKRLQREARILEANQQRIRKRLTDIDKRREVLLGLMRTGLGTSVSQAEQPAKPVSAQASKKHGASPANFEEMALEY